MNILNTCLRNTLITCLVTGGLSAAALAQPVDPSNSDNPFDYVGALHNEGLDYAIAAHDPTNDDWVAVTAGTLQQIDAFVSDHFPSSSPCSLLMSAEQLAMSLDSTNDTFQSFLDQHLTPQQVAYANAILEAIDIQDNDPTATLGRLRDLETNIVRDLATEEAEPLQIMASVARHSAAYWTHEVFRGPESAWGILGTTIGEVVGDPITRGSSGLMNKLSGADTKGAIVGFIVSGGNPGAAVINGIRASALEFLGNIIDWFLGLFG